jgi:hypothetical protein
MHFFFVSVVVIFVLQTIFAPLAMAIWDFSVTAQKEID